MAWRPADWVLDGELDNTHRDWTIGWIRLLDREEPLRLKLAGNCHPDFAGWRFRLVRPEPLPAWTKPADYEGIATDQSGTIGDVTADQMLHHYECSDDEFVRLLHDGRRPPTTLHKALYLEWFSHRNGRVVIQSTRLKVERLGERAFELTEDEWQEQAKYNQRETHFFMDRLGDALAQQPMDDADEG
jgi:hypothetical protein